ncbi:alkene reductase [Methylobacterium sp. J-068]|uniref:alkene reductase n=1 Tax=Methylobacterium sp. J-068 TaxID=2836649 RepID=UPI001FBA50E3|nr:alkene reductase [Methylobacterium sp. J-068]MCJ2035183.1 alkene reductase [Methylobacterium sp. J-068]
MPSLSDPIRIGAIDAKNRVFMAPLTRGRATREHVPTPIMVEYYRQRASAGLILTEATGISREGLGWPFAPGIWSDEQVEAWKPIVQAVHDAGGRIVCQLWHMGRIVHPDFLGGQPPVSASATTAPDAAHTYEGKKPYAEARPLSIDEMPRLRADYERAARNAIRAGFDGVQIHAANGYLIDQFLRDGSNLRTDAYGGSVENRIRLLTEVTQTVADAVGKDRTGVRLSPNGAIQGVDDSNPDALFGAAAAALSKIGIAFLELREPGPNGTFGTANHAPVAPTMKTAFDGPLILNSDYDGASAQKALDAGYAEAIAFGRPFIANPDLPQRLVDHAPLNKDEQKTWYSQGPEGYIDYPTRDTAKAA